jgi:serine/threonine-protein kinase
VARDVPKSLRRIVHKALRGNPEDRYQTGADLRDELRAWLLSQGKPFGPKEAARELASLVFKQSPHETRAFPTEQGVLLTPEQAQSTKKRLH